MKEDLCVFVPLWFEKSVMNFVQVLTVRLKPHSFFSKFVVVFLFSRFFAQIGFNDGRVGPDFFGQAAGDFLAVIQHHQPVAQNS